MVLGPRAFGADDESRRSATGTATVLDYPFDSIRKAPAKAGAFLMERTTRFELATLTLAR